MSESGDISVELMMFFGIAIAIFLLYACIYSIFKNIGSILFDE